MLCVVGEIQAGAGASLAVCLRYGAIQGMSMYASKQLQTDEGFLETGAVEQSEARLRLRHCGAAYRHP